MSSIHYALLSTRISNSPQSCVFFEGLGDGLLELRERIPRKQQLHSQRSQVPPFPLPFSFPLSVDSYREVETPRYTYDTLQKSMKRGFHV